MKIERNKKLTLLRSAIVLAAFTTPLISNAQTPSQTASTAKDASNHSSHQHPQSGATGGDLSQQVAQLQRQVNDLQAAVKQQGVSPGGMMKQGMARRSMQKMGAGAPMGQGPQMGPGMGGMAGGGMGMGMMDDNMMAMMGQMMGGMMGGAMGQMGPGSQLSALPGYPGASHLYHVGSTNFFLDHPGHILLTPDQQQRLSQIRDRALADQAEAARVVAEAENELWQLTSADQPSLSKIESKIREIEKIKGDDRLALIKAVGEATKVLTDQQKQALLGQIPPMNTAQAPMGAGAMPQQPGGMMDDDSMEMPPMPSSGGMGGSMPPAGGGSGGGMSGGMGDM